MAKKQKLTGLFPGTVKPVRQGVYQLKNGDYVRWQDGRWFLACDTAEEAEAEHIESGFQGSSRLNDCWQWRGLAEKPE